MKAIVAWAMLVLSAPCSAEPRGLAVGNKHWNDDFDRMLERRMVRVYAPYSRSPYFNDKGRERGLSAELVRDFERWLNQKYAKQLGKRPLTIYIVPATRDKLLPDVAQGLADIAIGNLTVTPERQELVDFVSPASLQTVDEVVVTGPASPRDCHARRSCRQEGARAARLELLRKPGRAERTSS